MAPGKQAADPRPPVAVGHTGPPPRPPLLPKPHSPRRSPAPAAAGVPATSTGSKTPATDADSPQDTDSAPFAASRTIPPLDDHPQPPSTTEARGQKPHPQRKQDDLLSLHQSMLRYL